MEGELQKAVQAARLEPRERETWSPPYSAADSLDGVSQMATSLDIRSFLISEKAELDQHFQKRVPWNTVSQGVSEVNGSMAVNNFWKCRVTMVSLYHCPSSPRAYSFNTTFPKLFCTRVQI